MVEDKVTVHVEKSEWKKLHQLKLEWEKESLSQVIKQLIKEHEKQ